MDNQPIPSSVKRRSFQKDVDASAIKNHKQSRTWIILANKILDDQFPQQPGETDEEFHQRKEYCTDGKKHKYTTLLKDGASSVRLNHQYRLVYHWVTPQLGTFTKWTLNASDGKYLKAIITPSDRQNDK